MSERRTSGFVFEPERVFDDLYAMPLPLPDGTPVNAYVCVGSDGVWLIDGGIGSSTCQATLARGLAELGWSPADVRGVLISHGHPDHVGAADAVARGGGEVLAHPLEDSAGREVGFDEDLLRRHGLPAGDEDPRSGWLRAFSWPRPTRLVEDGQRLQWGPLELEVIWCPGHTPGLVCLLDRRRRVLFTSDHLMRRAPTPVSIRAGSRDDPLADFLGSLRKLAGLPVETVLPGHGRPFSGLDQRLAEMEGMIEQQVSLIRARLADGPASAWELLAIEGLRDRRRIQNRYALSQVLARVRFLERRGEIVGQATADGPVVYSARSRR